MSETPETTGDQPSDTRQSLADLAALTGAAPAPVKAEVTDTVVNDEDAAPARPVSTMPLRDKIIDAQGRSYATGRRKDAVARV